MARKSIARRWFFNSFSVILIFLLVINVSVYFALRGYYYDAVRRTLGTQANIIYGVLSYFDDYAPEIRRAVEEFENKNHMELMAITADGRIDITSSGFSPPGNYQLPDYERARLSERGRADYVGRLPNSERYMAVTVMLSGEVYDAIRVVTSLDRIDAQIATVTIVVALLSMAVMLLVLFLGMYFIKSIVFPLRQIGNSAKKLASGDFSDRVAFTKHDDEISELCRIFNSMADDLENSEKIKNDFISSVSHELRTPLTAIKGWGETVLEIGSDADSRQTFEKGMRVITSETSRLSDLVEDLLDFSKMQSGHMKLQKANMDVLAELTDALSIYAEKAKRERVSISFTEPEPDVIAMIYGDKNRIRQVFINIIDNAVKYSAPGGSVVVDTRLLEDKIIITISDNGCGISEKDLPKVKTRFFKANSSVRGSGIGLAVADEIITLHEGILEIESKQHKGTTARITLPISPIKR